MYVFLSVLLHYHFVLTLLAFWVTVTSNGLPCVMGLLSGLSVTLVYRGHMVGWIKIPLGMEVGLVPGDIVC